MAMSPLTSGSSSPASYYTANDSELEGSTTASSPVQVVPCLYRDARPFPRELQDHCQILLEEQIYTCAINFLNSTLGSGTWRTAPPRKPVLVPPPSHLALLSTLMIHPLHTTRADHADQQEVASMALDYLRNLLTLVGPVNAGFRAAFQFHAVPRGRRSALTSIGSDSDMSDSDVDRDGDRLKGSMANQSSLWNRGQDLWTTVGWAFNTSTLYPHRWRYWKVWLEFMLDVLESDWHERERQDEAAEQAPSSGEGGENLAAREQAMVIMYMKLEANGQTTLRRIIKALFADGTSLYTSSYQQVFDKEPRGLRKPSPSRKRKRQVLDLENEKYGDYFDDDSISSGSSEPPTPQKINTQHNASKQVALGLSSPGLVESIGLRLRFFGLLSAATHALGERGELNRLYEDFALSIKSLRLEVFALYVTQKENPLSPEVHVTIIKALFDHLLPSKYKNPADVDPDGDAEGSLTQSMLEQCYLPLPANTVALEDNAKLSLVVESAIQLLWLNDLLEYTDSFAEACDVGIHAREAKAKRRRTGKSRFESSDVSAQQVLSASGDRIRMLVAALRGTSPG